MNTPLQQTTATNLHISREHLAQAVQRAGDSGEAIPVYLNLPVESDDLLSLIAGEEDDRFRYYSEKPDEAFALAGLGTVLSYGFKTPRDRQAVTEKILRTLALSVDCTRQSLPAGGPRFLGGFAFVLEGPPSRPWQDFPRGLFVLPQLLAVRQKGRTVVTITALVHPGDDGDSALATLRKGAAECLAGLAALVPGEVPISCVQETELPQKTDWVPRVRDVISRLGPRLSKVVLARALHLEFNRTVPLHQVLHRLRRGCPECVTFMFSQPGAGSFLGATPERLLSLLGGAITTEALAGTTVRGQTPAEDDALGAALLANPKERAEHASVVAAIREKLAPLTSELAIPQEPTLFRLKNMIHLRTPITARLAAPVTGLELAVRLHPTPAVAGSPTAQALDAIQALETGDRGWYSGVLGWIDSKGNGQFIVGLRSAFIRGNSACLFAGGGIMAGSIPEKEWEETGLKFKAMRFALSTAQPSRGGR